MGYTLTGARALARLSSHNTERDKTDLALWQDFVTRVRAIADEDKYKEILLDFQWPED